MTVMGDGLSGDQYRHKLTKEQKRLRDIDLARAVPSGTGVSIARFAYWDVVARLSDKGVLEYIVTDCSIAGLKPQRVHGPESRAEAMAWARREAALWRALHVHHPDDEPGLK